MGKVLVCTVLVLVLITSTSRVGTVGTYLCKWVGVQGDPAHSITAKVAFHRSYQLSRAI